MSLGGGFGRGVEMCGGDVFFLDFLLYLEGSFGKLVKGKMRDKVDCFMVEVIWGSWKVLW